MKTPMHPTFPPHGSDHPQKSDIRHRRHGSAIGDLFFELRLQLIAVHDGERRCMPDGIY